MKKKTLKLIIEIQAILLVSFLILAIDLYTEYGWFLNLPIQSSMTEDIKRLEKIDKVLSRTYYYEKDESVNKIIRDNLIKSYLKSLEDPYACYESAPYVKAKKKYRNQITSTGTELITDYSDENPVYFSQFNDEIGYIRLKDFRDGIATQFKAPLNIFKDTTKSLIIDLRGNRGGNMEDAIEMVDMFVDKGKTIVKQVSKDDIVVQEFKAKTNAIYKGKVVILVDDITASASELFSQSLKDCCNARIISSSDKTYGKGVVQSLFVFDDGSVIKWTTSKFVHPSRWVGEQGVEIDFKIESKDIMEFAKNLLSGV